MYRVFLRYAPVVMAVSCDEAFLELAEGTDPMEAATWVRRTETFLYSIFVTSSWWQHLHTSECFTTWRRGCTLL